jgi:dihydrofolate synthase/folylpolyglutamate synthase
MRGAHQWDNLATALAAVAVAAPQLLDDGRGWRTALEATQLPGRLSRHAGDDRIILDVGHNPLAAEVVAAELASRTGGRVHCVLGMLRDKDAESVARVLAGQVDRWYFAGLQGDRGQSGAALQRRVRSVLPEPEAEAYADVAAALEAARDCAAAEDLILVFGSFGTAAAALRALSARTAGTAH